jgi:hypothetical protein
MSTFLACFLFPLETSSSLFDGDGYLIVALSRARIAPSGCGSLEWYESAEPTCAHAAAPAFFLKISVDSEEYRCEIVSRRVVLTLVGDLGQRVPQLLLAYACGDYDLDIASKIVVNDLVMHRRATRCRLSSRPLLAATRRAARGQPGHNEEQICPTTQLYMGSAHHDVAHSILRGAQRLLRIHVPSCSAA